MSCPSVLLSTDAFGRLDRELLGRVFRRGAEGTRVGGSNLSRQVALENLLRPFPKSHRAARGRLAQDGGDACAGSSVQLPSMRMCEGAAGVPSPRAAVERWPPRGLSRGRAKARFRCG